VVFPGLMNSRERELLEGMGNCYATCGEDFHETTRMVASARGLAQSQVLAMLKEMREKYSDDEEYKKLRQRLPNEFPM
jgi:hypothetical protein